MLQLNEVCLCASTTDVMDSSHGTTGPFVNVDGTWCAACYHKRRRMWIKLWPGLAEM